MLSDHNKKNLIKRFSPDRYCWYLLIAKSLRARSSARDFLFSQKLAFDTIVFVLLKFAARLYPVLFFLTKELCRYTHDECDGIIVIKMLTHCK